MRLWFEYPGVAERFDAKVDRTADCWMWTASRMGGKEVQYGAFRLAWPVRRKAYPHRLALERKLGRQLAPGEQALHSCDNPPCVNPDHLRVGSRSDNMADSLARGRFARGEAKPLTARLTETQVKEIRALATVADLTRKNIGDRYGISATQVGNIASRRSWKHVP